MTFTITVNGKEYIFRDELTLGEALECEIRPDMSEQEQLEQSIKRVCMQSVEPKLTRDTLMNGLSEFEALTLISEIQTRYLRKRVQMNADLQRRMMETLPLTEEQKEQLEEIFASVTPDDENFFGKPSAGETS